jgi:hypothetical protein
VHAKPLRHAPRQLFAALAATAPGALELLWLDVRFADDWLCLGPALGPCGAGGVCLGLGPCPALRRRRDGAADAGGGAFVHEAGKLRHVATGTCVALFGDRLGLGSCGGAVGFAVVETGV